MGCLYSYQFLKNMTAEWKKTNVRALIAIAAPWKGNFRYLYDYFRNDDDLGARLIPRIRSTERTFSGLAYLIPTATNETLIESSTKNYTDADYQAFFDRLNNSNAYEMWKDTKDYHDISQHPGTDVYCFGGSGIPTMSKLKYSGEFPNSTFSVIRTDGDGILAKQSMESCRIWQNESSHKFEYKEFRHTHMGLIQHLEPVSYIGSVLRSFLN